MYISIYICIYIYINIYIYIYIHIYIYVYMTCLRGSACSHSPPIRTRICRRRHRNRHHNSSVRAKTSRSSNMMRPRLGLPNLREKRPNLLWGSFTKETRYFRDTPA